MFGCHRSYSSGRRNMLCGRCQSYTVGFFIVGYEVSPRCRGSCGLCSLRELRGLCHTIGNQRFQISGYCIAYMIVIAVAAFFNTYTAGFKRVFKLSSTHCPKPLRPVVIVGTPNATLSNGVYPHGS